MGLKSSVSSDCPFMNLDAIIHLHPYTEPVQNLGDSPGFATPA